MVQGIVGKGWSLVWRHSRILGWVFGVNLVFGIAATVTPRIEFGNILDHSLASSRLANGFDLGAFIELLSKPEISFGALARGSMPFSYLFFLFMLFITGGILTAYREDRRLTTGEFFEAAGSYFWRMVRIFLFSLIPLAVVGVVTAIVIGISSQIDNEQTAFYVRLVGLAVAVILVLLVRLWFDVAQVRAVAQNEHGMFHNVMRALVISLKAFGSLLWIYLRISIVAWFFLAVGLWLWAKLPGDQVGGSWLLLEFVLFTQLLARLWQRAASVTWYGQYAEEHPAAAVEFTTPQPAEITESPVISDPFPSAEPS
jgi:hypothetical protein